MPVPNQVAIAAALRQIAELERRVAALEQRPRERARAVTRAALADNQFKAEMALRAYQDRCYPHIKTVGDISYVDCEPPNSDITRGFNELKV